MSLRVCIELVEIVFGDDDYSSIEITDTICAKILPEDIFLSLYGRNHIVKWILDFYIYKNYNSIISVYPQHCREAYQFFNGCHKPVAAKHLLNILSCIIKGP